MKKNVVLILSLLVFIFASEAPAHAALSAKVYPRKVSPGDAFVIKVTGVKSSRPPSAFFMKKELPFGSCGRACYLAVGAVDIESKPKSYPVTVRAGKSRRNLRLIVKPRKFPEVSLTLPDEKVTPDAEAMERVEEENKELAQIFQEVSEELFDGRFLMPLGNELSTVFGTKRIMNGKWTSVHRGLDIRGREGEEVEASNGGRVVLAKELFYGGNTLILDHGLGIYTIYMHLSGFAAKAGDYVEKADIIGFVGSTGRSTGPHLHFGVKVLGVNVDPVSLIRLKL